MSFRTTTRPYRLRIDRQHQLAPETLTPSALTRIRITAVQARRIDTGIRVSIRNGTEHAMATARITALHSCGKTHTLHLEILPAPER
ncbi:MAG: hypothetical protein ACOYUK_04110 [Patescibacteria group bacterium]